MHRRELLKTSATIAGTSLLGGSAANAAQSTRRTTASNLVPAAGGAQLFCRDWGEGAPIVFLSGWGLPSDSWSYTMAPLAASGFRCIAFDRRGHGRSGDPGRGYDYDTLADDLAAVLDALDVKNGTLVAHSMSGGEAVRYLRKHGSARIGRLALVGTTLPFLTKSADNPDGVDPAIFEQLRNSWAQDFPRWLQANARPFFLPDTSDALMNWGMGLMQQTSLQAILECNRAMTQTDFRPELQKLTVPALVIHGDKDASAPLALTGARAARLLPNAQLKVYAGPHGLPITHARQLAEDIRGFI
jgi:non-heme chloroperoxidase